MNNRENKAHTATANRIAQKYGAKTHGTVAVDLQVDDMLIEVETTATLEQAIGRLSELPGRVFVAVTNKDGIRDALRLTEGTRVGVMDPRGEIVKDASRRPKQKPR